MTDVAEEGAASQTVVETTGFAAWRTANLVRIAAMSASSRRKYVGPKPAPESADHRSRRADRFSPTSREWL